jgi:hypothetical protein
VGANLWDEAKRGKAKAPNIAEVRKADAAREIRRQDAAGIACLFTHDWKNRARTYATAQPHTQVMSTKTCSITAMTKTVVRRKLVV